jgi:hypothetical protein
MKRSEVNRFEEYLKSSGEMADGPDTDWEQREYFRLF